MSICIVWDIFLKQAFAICAKEFVLQSLDRIIPPLNLQRPIGLKFTLSCKWLEKVAFQTTMRWWTDSMSQALHTLAEENWKSIRTISLTLFHKDRWEGNRFISLRKEFGCFDFLEVIFLIGSNCWRIG